MTKGEGEVGEPVVVVVSHLASRVSRETLVSQPRRRRRRSPISGPPFTLHKCGVICIYVCSVRVRRTSTIQSVSVYIRVRLRTYLRAGLVGLVAEGVTVTRYTRVCSSLYAWIRICRIDNWRWCLRRRLSSITGTGTFDGTPPRRLRPRR